MIYTIGTRQIKGKLDIPNTLIIDVRSRPYRIPFINTGILHFPLLGGFIETTDEIRIRELRKILELSQKGNYKDILLFCAERNFKKCHRHYHLTRLLHQMDIDVYHIIGEVSNWQNKRLLKAPHIYDNGETQQNINYELF